jgi:hypothetical protein
MRKYMSERPMQKRYQSHMLRVDSTLLRCLLLSLTLLRPGTVVAQEPALLADPTEVAVEPLPSAPMYIAEVGSGLPLPANSASMPPVAFVPVTVRPEPPPIAHRFWDGENRVLFATVGAFAAADFCATRANLAKGGTELNPVTRVLSGSTPGLAANFALEAGGVMAISYLFHRTGHHKLERIASLVNIGTSATAVGYDLTHRQR